MRTTQIFSFSLSISFFLLCIGILFYCQDRFSKNFIVPLESAIMADDVSSAKEELTKAIAYLEKESLISGYTSILWKTSDQDVGIFYGKLEELLDASEEAGITPMFFPNLEKIRWKIPRGMPFFPYNRTMALLLVSAVFFLFCGFFWKELSGFFTQLNNWVEGGRKIFLISSATKN